MFDFKLVILKMNAMKKIILFALLSIISLLGFSQSCLPEGIVLTTQSQVDSFQYNYPGCTQIEGTLEIKGNGITDISALNIITNIGGDLIIRYCNNLYSLQGLNSITAISGTLKLSNNSKLTNLQGLNSIVSIGGNVTIEYCSSLQNFSGCSSLISINGSLQINENDNLWILQVCHNYHP